MAEMQRESFQNRRSQMPLDIKERMTRFGRRRIQYDDDSIPHFAFWAEVETDSMGVSIFPEECQFLTWPIIADLYRRGAEKGYLPCPLATPPESHQEAQTSSRCES